MWEITHQSKHYIAVIEKCLYMHFVLKLKCVSVFSVSLYKSTGRAIALPLFSALVLVMASVLALVSTNCQILF